MDPSTNSSSKFSFIRYRFGMAPDRRIDRDPGFVETVRSFDRTDAAVLIATVLIPSAYGYRIQSKN